jgi:hypothetical protein
VSPAEQVRSANEDLGTMRAFQYTQPFPFRWAVLLTGCDIEPYSADLRMEYHLFAQANDGLLTDGLRVVAKLNGPEGSELLDELDPMNHVRSLGVEAFDHAQYERASGKLRLSNLPVGEWLQVDPMKALQRIAMFDDGRNAIVNAMEKSDLTTIRGALARFKSPRFFVTVTQQIKLI